MIHIQEFVKDIGKYEKIVVVGTYGPIDHLVTSFAKQLEKIPLLENKIVCPTTTVNKTDEQSDDVLYIIFCAQHFVKFPKHYVCFQVEQYSSHWLQNKEYQTILKNAEYVIDYSKENIDNITKFPVFVERCPAFVHIPFLFDPSLTLPTPKVSEIGKPIDVLLIGHITERRAKFVRGLSDKLVVVAKNLVTDEEWNYLASRSKIFLNIHSFEGPHIIETSRLIRCLANNCFVVSEDSTSPSENKCMEPFPSMIIVKSGDYEELKRKIFEYVSKDEERDTLVAKSNENLKNYTMTALLENQTLLS